MFPDPENRQTLFSTICFFLLFATIILVGITNGSH